MLQKIGDVDADEEFNKAISPLFHIDAIKAPLLIGQGANDPRVKQAEADQIAFAMAEKGIPVDYVLYPDEGHGWARPVNRIDFNGRTELFLAEHLGGRSEPFEAPEGATAQFPLESRLPAGHNSHRRHRPSFPQRTGRSFECYRNRYLVFDTHCQFEIDISAESRAHDRSIAHA